jgi:tRNA G18 (ribose-2'-O)-methylase SpoU
MYDTDFSGSVVVALGGEKRGLSGALRKACNGFFTIPMSVSHNNSLNGVPSLSLSHSAAIVMAEVMRQRQSKISVILDTLMSVK